MNSMVCARLWLSVVALGIISGCCTPRTQEQKPIVLNVLDKTMYDDCHIPGSVQVDFDKVEAYLSAAPKDAPIVVYCSNYACTTSHFVVKKLLAKGYTQARVYAGGMAAWLQEGYPVEGPAQMPYLHKEMAQPEAESHDVATISTKELAELLKIV